MKITITLLLAMISFHSISCDVCGGIAAPNTLGLLSGNGYHFIGFRQTWGGFKTRHQEDYSSFVRNTREHFTLSSLNGRWQMNRRINFQVALPFAFNLQQENDDIRSEYGIGDISISSNYLVVNNKNEVKDQTLNFTTGVRLKLPTGKYVKNAWETSNLYPGTGAYDFSINTNLVYSQKSIGMLQENSFTLRTENPVGYKFGNNVFSRLNAFYKKTTKNASLLMPFTGVSYLYTGTDKIQGIDVDQLFNSGHVLNSELGLNILTQKWMFQIRGTYPIFQYIVDGDVTSLGSLELNINYLIQKK
jgi:hypothetical protein